MKSTATLLKKPPNLLRKDSWTKQFSGNHQDNGTSSAKHLLQSPFFLSGNNLSFKLKLYYNVQDLNCRPKILQQRDSNTDSLTGNFLKFLKKSFVFRVCLLVGSLLVKLKTITFCFKLHIFHDHMNTVSIDKFIFRNIVGGYQNKNPLQTFLCG